MHFTHKHKETKAPAMSNNLQMLKNLQ